MGDQPGRGSMRGRHQLLPRPRFRGEPTGEGGAARRVDESRDDLALTGEDAEDLRMGGQHQGLDRGSRCGGQSADGRFQLAGQRHLVLAGADVGAACPAGAPGGAAGEQHLAPEHLGFGSGSC
jgi:hypothetical protein